jgi:hypothetical protein
VTTRKRLLALRPALLSDALGKASAGFTLDVHTAGIPRVGKALHVLNPTQVMM